MKWAEVEARHAPWLKWHSAADQPDKDANVLFSLLTPWVEVHVVERRRNVSKVTLRKHNVLEVSAPWYGRRQVLGGKEAKAGLPAQLRAQAEAGVQAAGSIEAVEAALAARRIEQYACEGLLKVEAASHAGEAVMYVLADPAGRVALSWNKEKLGLVRAWYLPAASLCRMAGQNIEYALVERAEEGGGPQVCVLGAAAVAGKLRQIEERMADATHTTYQPPMVRVHATGLTERARRLLAVGSFDRALAGKAGKGGRRGVRSRVLASLLRGERYSLVPPESTGAAAELWAKLKKNR